MSAKEFSFKAELLWSMIPPDAQKGILEAVWCGQCRSAVAITDYFGTETNGNLILEGRCARCGGRVRRFVETSEAPPPQN